MKLKRIENCTLFTMFSFAGLIALFVLGLVSIFRPAIELNGTLIRAFSMIIGASLTLKNMSSFYFKKKPDGTIEINFNTGKPAVDKTE